MMKYIHIKKITAVLFTFFVLMGPTLLFAEQPPSTPTQSQTITIQNPLRSGTNTIPQFLDLVLTNVIMPLAGVIAVIYIMLAGFKFVIARGNEKEIGDAKQALLYAAIGTAILLGAAAISGVIKATIDQVVGQ
jgi:hypothetical protein